MTVTKAVIEDLLPTYAAGEASEDTKRLVEEFLSGDAELRERVKAALSFHLPSASPPADLERRALNETRKLLGRRNSLLSMAFAISFSSFSFAFSDGQVKFLLFRDLPPLALLLSTMGLGIWFLVVHGGRRFRETGLAMVSGRTPFQWFGGGMLVALPMTITMSQWWGNWANLITVGVATASYWMARRK